MDTFVSGLKYIAGDRILLVKEAIETLIAADNRELASEFLQKIDERKDHWDGEDKNQYFTLVMNNLGSLELQDCNYTQALLYFNNAFEYFKKFKSATKAETNGDDSNKLLFEILHSISTCCLEEGDMESAYYFNRKVSLPIFRSQLTIFRQKM